MSANIDTPLVIVGSRGWRSEGELGLLNAERWNGLNISNRILRLDYMPETLLMTVVRGARLVAFPSLYEGFGLPVLEAMSLGVPVLTSDARVSAGGRRPGGD